MQRTKKSKKKLRKENPIISENGDLFPLRKSKKEDDGRSSKRKPSSGNQERTKKSKTSSSPNRGLISSMEHGLVFGGGAGKSSGTRAAANQRVELLSIKDIKSEMQLLAAVKEIKSLEIIVSLPDGILGSISASEISDELTELFKEAAADPENSTLPDLKQIVQIGQLIRTVVLSVTLSPARGHTIALSMRPSRVNAGLIKEQISDGMNLYAVVKSVEGYGYVLSFGVPDLSGFLKKINVDEDVQYVVGQPLETVVISKPAGARAAVVSAKRELVSRSLISDGSFVALNALRVGMLVNGKVTAAVQRTVQIQFLELFTGYVDAFHVPMGQRYAAGQKVRARIIAVDYESKRVKLSLIPHILHLTPFSFAPELRYGLRLRARVARIDNGVGAMFEMYVPPEGTNEEEEDHDEDQKAEKTKKEETEGADEEANQDEEKAEENGSDANEGDEDGLDEMPADETEGEVPLGNEEVEGFAPAEDYNLDDDGNAEGGDHEEEDGEEADKPHIPQPDKDIGTRLRGYGYAILSRLSDDPIKRVQDKCTMGRAYRSKVLGFNYFEGVVNLTLKKSVLNQKYDTYADVPAGELVECEIVTIGSMGLLVQLTPTIRGLISSLHLADVPISKPEKMFRVGQKVTARVLSVDTERKRMKLTLKKTLVKSKLPIITSYDQLQPDMIVNTFVLAVKPNGIVVSMYNDVTGYVPPEELHLSTEHKSLAEVFKPGQVYKARVVSVDARREHCRMSLRTKATEEEIAKNASFSLYHLGQILSKCKIASADEHGNIFVRVSRYIQAYLPAEHLTDFLDNVDAMRAKFSAPKTVLPELLVIDTNSIEKTLTVTMKRSMISVAKNNELPENFDSLKDGLVLQGWIQSVEPYGVFVGFGNSVFGLASKNNLYDEHDHGKRAPFQKGQSVRAYVLSAQPAERKSNLSLKPSLTSTRGAGLYLESYFYDQSLLAGSPNQCDSFHAGMVVTAEIVAHESFGVLATVATETGAVVNALAIPAQVQVKPKIGDKLNAVVLDVDPVKVILDISFLPNKLKAAENLSKAQAAFAKRTTSKPVEAVVELVKEKYAVVSLVSFPGLIGCAALAEWNTAVADPFLLFKAGQRVNVAKAGNESAQRLLLSLEGSLTHLGAALSSTSDAREGQLVKCRVVSKDQHQMMVSLGPHIRGRVYLTEVMDETPENEGEPKSVFEPFALGDLIEGKVLEIKETISKRSRAISHSTSHVVRTFDVTLRKSHLSLPAGELAPCIRSIKDVKPDTVHVGVVVAVSKQGLGVALSSRVRGLLRFHSSRHSRYIVGQPIKCKVVRVQNGKKLVELTTVLEEVKPPAVGSMVEGCVVKQLEGDGGLRVALGPRLYGRVHLTDIADQYSAEITVQKGDVVRCYVLAVQSEPKQIDLSTRASRVSPDTADKSPLNPEIKSLDDLKEDQLVQGYVRHTSEKGCFISLNRNLTGRAVISQLSDGYIREPAAAFPAGRLVTARVISIDRENGRVELSLKRSVLQKTKHYLFADIKPGMRINGTIGSIKDFGIFVDLDNSSLRGMCHSSEVSDEPVNKPLSQLYAVGDYVRCLVLRTRPEKRTISLSLKPSNFKDEKPEDTERSDSGLQPAEAELLKQMIAAEAPPVATSKPSRRTLVREEGEKAKKQTEDEEDDEVIVQPEQLDLLFGSDEEDDEEVPELYGVAAENATTTKAALPAVGFQWEEEKKVEIKTEPGATAATVADSKKRKAANTTEKVEKTKRPAPAEVAPIKVEESNEEAAEGDSSSDDEDAPEQPSDLSSESKPSAGKSRSAKKAARARLESETRAAEERLLEDRSPETAADFDRLLLASPNSSFLWIKYIAHLLSAGDQNGARAVAEKALETINYREQKERLNVWVALMNLENIYGTQDSLMKVFERALAVNDPKTIHFHLIDIFERSNNTAMVESTFKAMIRKFKESQKLWTRYITFQFKQKKPEDARAILARSLQSLPKRKHLPMISKFAQLEFSMGSPERGRTVFEELLANNPKRVDLWNIYLDMEVSKVGSADTIRHLFDRVCSLNLSTKKMKFFFKRYLNWEKEHGTEATQQKVKEMARQYLESKLAAS